MTDLLDRPTIDLDDAAPADAGLNEAPPGDVDLEGAEPPARPTRWYDRYGLFDWLELAATVLVVGGCVLFTLMQLHPDLILANNTPTGGDMGAHVWAPAYLRDHILPHLRLSGWSPDWYAGFPMYTYYMVIPGLLVVLLNVVLPYGIAFKIITVLGILTLPVASWAFGKLAGMRFPIPPMLAVAATVFLFDETFTIYGGNIASTMAGEFSFSIALSLAMLYLGVFAYGMRTGKHRALAVVLFALACLCHLIVAFFAIIGTLILWLLWADRRRTIYLVSVGIVGGLLTAFWVLPFAFNGLYVTDMFYERRDDYWAMFFPQATAIDRAMFALALIALVVAVIRGTRAIVGIGLLCLFYGVWAWVWPQSHLWNARLLPFFYLTRYFLVAIGLVEVGRFFTWLWLHQDVNAALRRSEGGVRQWLGERTRSAVSRTGGLVTVSIMTVLGLGALGFHLQNLPFGQQVVQNGKYVYRWGPIEGTKQGFVDSWARWNYSGYEGKEAYGEYHGVVTTMKGIGETNGCGRALWENNNVQDRYGTPMAMMLLPFWTDGCIGSMEGLFFEASGTTPYHFLSTAALSQGSSNPVRRLVYENGNVDKGVEYLQQMGVRYYLAFSSEIVAKADKNTSLTPLAVSGPWHVYEVKDAPLVVGLPNQPIVLTGAGNGVNQWLEAGTSWFQDPTQRDVEWAASGPPSWERIGTAYVGDLRTDDIHLAKVKPATVPEKVALPPVVVSNIKTSDDGIEFDVDKVGVPTLVKVSYFPNWTASGAQGPWRVAPNFMVVVPTSNHVKLSYGRSQIELVSMGLTLVGVIGAIWLWRRGPVHYGNEPAQVVAGASPPPPPSDDGPPSLLVDWEDTSEWHG